MTKRSFGPLEQHEARAVATNLELHHEGLLGQGRKTDAPLHIDQQRLQIEILIRWLARQPAPSPCAEGTYEACQFLPRFRECVFRAVGPLSPGDRPGEDKGLEPLGKDRAGHAGNAPPDVVEATAATQDFSYDQKRPP